MAVDFYHPSMRWLILFLSCWLLFGNFYAFDNPSSLNRQLMTWLGSDYESYQFQLNAMYTVYSFPNIILPIFTGGLLDRWGVHSLLILFAALVAIGQGIFCLGVQYRSFTAILLGRIIFGFGGESLTVAQARLVTDWFLGKELALAIGLNLSVARLGTVLNNILSPFFSDYFGIVWAVWIGFLACVLSLACALFTVSIDLKCSNPAKSKPTGDQNRFSIVDTLKSSYIVLKTFHPAFVLVCLVSFAYYGSLIPFNNVASDFLQVKWYKGDIFSASMVMSIPDTLAIFLVPLLGHFVDKLGYKVSMITIGGVLMTFGHLLLAMSHIPPIFPLCLNGLANTTLLAIWPCIPLLVPEPYWALAYGIITMCINISYSFIPLIVAALVGLDPSYYSAEIFFMLLTLFGTLMSVLLAHANREHYLGLDITESEATSQAFKASKASRLPKIPTFAAPFEPLLVIQELPDLPHIESLPIPHSECWPPPIRRRRSTEPGLHPIASSLPMISTKDAEFNGRRRRLNTIANDVMYSMYHQHQSSPDDVDSPYDRLDDFYVSADESAGNHNSGSSLFGSPVGGASNFTDFV